MSLIRMGLGHSAALLLTLGLATATPVPETGGSYVTLGQGQSASRFLRLGLAASAAITPPPEEPLTYGGGTSIRRGVPIYRLPPPDRQRADEELLILLL